VNDPNVRKTSVFIKPPPQNRDFYAMAMSTYLLNPHRRIETSTRWQCPPVCLFICLLPEMLQLPTRVSLMFHHLSKLSCREKSPFEIYACGWGLRVVSVNVSQLL